MRRGAFTSTLVFALVVATTAAAQAPESELARLQAEVARLDRELREHKQLFTQMVEADKRRYEVLLQLIRGIPGAPPPPASLTAPEKAPAAAAPAPEPPPPPPTATINGRVRLPAGTEEAYVYLEGKGPARSRLLEIKQQNKQFLPQVAVVPVGSRVTFPNADVVYHNVFSRTPGSVFDLGTIKTGDTPAPVTLFRPGHVEVFCNIHSRMRADLLVVPNNHFAKIRPDGSFSLPGVPVGNRKLVVWGPALKTAAQTVSVRPGVSVELAAEAAPPGAHLNKFGQAYRSYDE
jgi:plastocyanin